MNLEITAIGYVTLPVTMAIFLFRPSWLLPWTVLLMPFHAASFMNIRVGDYPMGFQPGYLAAVLFLVSATVREVFRGKIRLPSALLLTYLPLFMFAIYAVLTAAVLPRAFQDAVLVLPPRAGVSLDNLSPLGPMGTNISQAAYLLFFTGFAFLASLTVAQGNSSMQQTATRAYLWACWIAAAIGFYQIAAWYLRLPYPTGALYSNPTYYQGFEQVLHGIKRLSSTFTEPSVAACFFAGFFAFSITSYIGSAGAWRWLLAVAVSFTALVLTTATTAYLTLAIILGGVAVYGLRQSLTSGLSPKIIGGIALAAALMALGVVGLLFYPAAVDVIGHLFEGAITQKAQTSSFTDRIGADLHSYKLLWETWGLGVGWGSSRPSSLLANIVSNAGVLGFAFAVWFLTAILDLTLRALRTTAIEPEETQTISALAASVFAMLAACVFAVPDINLLVIWCNIALLVGSSVRTVSRQRP